MSRVAKSTCYALLAGGAVAAATDPGVPEVWTVRNPSVQVRVLRFHGSGTHLGRWEPSPLSFVAPNRRSVRPCPGSLRGRGYLRRFRSCCSSSRVAPDRASASVTRAFTAGARCRVMACHSASVGSGTISPRRHASVNLVRLHPFPSGPMVAASRLSIASAPSRFVMGPVVSTCRHIRAASRRNLVPSLPAASSPLKARSSAVWASMAGMWEPARCPPYGRMPPGEFPPGRARRWLPG